jgi:hypothetical protein
MAPIIIGRYSRLSCMGRGAPPKRAAATVCIRRGLPTLTLCLSLLGCPGTTPSSSSLLSLHEPLCSNGSKTKKWGVPPTRRECLGGYPKADVQRPPLATLGSNSGARSPWTTGLTKQWGQHQGQGYTCGWLKSNGTRTKGQEK